MISKNYKVMKPSNLLIRTAILKKINFDTLDEQ